MPGTGCNHAESTRLFRPSGAVLIYNPKAGRMRRRTARQLRDARRELERAGISVTEQPTVRVGDATCLARSAVASGAELIIACGGDGTINEVVCGMAHSAVPLAVLPAGTANILAREIRLPLSIAGAARSIPSSRPQRLSLGCAGSRYFLLMAGVGFDARVVQRVSARYKSFLGMSTYILEAVRQALCIRPVPFILSNGEHRHQATFACISKSQHYGPIKMVREANLFSGQFYVYCFPSRSGLGYFRYALAVLSGTAHRLPDVSRFAATQIRCEPVDSEGGEVFLQVDGELVGQLPCDIKVVPDALTLLVPS